MRKRLLLLVCAVCAAVLALALPGLMRLLALLPALLVPVCAEKLSPPPVEDAWHVSRDVADRRLPPAVCLDLALMEGPPDYTARACVPVTTVPPERFRAQSGAMLLSCAAALTAPLLPDILPDAALTALSIRPSNLRRQYPALAETSLAGFPGVIARDGKGHRAFFVSADPALLDACAAIFDHAERPVTPADHAAIFQRPGLHFAAAQVSDGCIGPAAYLGSIEPIRVETAHPQALAACAALREAGLSIVFEGSGDHPLAADFRPHPAQRGNLLRVRRVRGDRLDFDAAVFRFLRWEEDREKTRTLSLLAGGTAALLPIAASSYLAYLGAPLLSPLGAGFSLCAAVLGLLPALALVFQKR